MTSPLSSILANISANIVQGDAGASEAAPSTLNTLSQAARLTTAANVTLVRLPEQILQIHTNGMPGAQIKLPSSLSLPPTTKLQLAVISSESNPERTLKDTGVIIQQETQTKSTQVSAQQVAQLTATLSKLIASQSNVGAQINGRIQHSESGSIQVSIPTGNTVKIAIPPQQMISGASLEQGQTVALSLKGDGKGALQVTVSAPRSAGPAQANTSTQLPSQTQTQSVALVTKISPSDTNAQALLTGALKQGGVAVSQQANQPINVLEKFLPPLKSPTMVQQASIFSLKGSSLTSTTVASYAVSKFTIPPSLQSSITSFSTDVLAGNHQQRLKSIVTSGILPESAMIASTKSGAAMNPAQSPQKSDMPLAQHSLDKANTQTGAAPINETVRPTENIKGTQVHQAIIALSRTLLSQTGSTQQALSQLLSIVNATRTSNANNQQAALQSPVKQASLAPQTKQFLNAIGEALTPLNSKAPAPIGKSLENKSRENAMLGGSSDTTSNTKSDKKVDIVNVENGKADAALPTKGESYVKRAWSQLTSALLANHKATGPSSINTVQQNSGANKSAIHPDLDSLSASPEKDKGAPKAASTSVQTDNPQSQTANPQMLSARIQSLLTAPALAITPLTLTNPVASSSFVQGLVALLQVSLAGRAVQRQPSLASLVERPDSIVSKTLAVNGVPTGSSSKVAQDMASIDARSNLMANLKTLLANHQQNKVSQVEARVQGQDSFYYVLPSLAQHTTAPELLIQREPDRQHKEQSPTNKHSQWNITMKLAVGEIGEVLAKSKITGETITLDLYVSNPVLLSRVGDTLPYLKQRLSELGLEVESTSFQRGNIPSTLNTRPHQIFETRV